MHMTRHALVLAAATLFSTSAFAQDAAQGPFTLSELPYGFDALEPVIDAQTMELHLTKHQKAFVDNLNKAVADGTIPATATVEELVATASTQPTGVRNSAGGQWNHSFFWTLMAPEGERGEASPELTAAIEGVYGSMDEFKAAFEKAGADRFGSGWVWLIVNDAGELEITSTPNQDNPLMDVAEVQGQPVLGNDVWEHAYYISYNNRRAEYLSTWWDVVDWDQVSENYADALTSR